VAWAGPSLAESPTSRERRPSPRERGRKSGDRKPPRSQSHAAAPAPERANNPERATTPERARTPERAKTAEQAKNPERAKPPRPPARPPQERHPERRPAERRPDRRPPDFEGPVMGLGDHVPAFLMRPASSSKDGK